VDFLRFPPDRRSIDGDGMLLALSRSGNVSLGDPPWMHMSTIPHTAFSSAREAGAWHDVSSVVQALGSALEPSQLCAAIREVLAERSGTPVEVFLIEPQKRLLQDPIGRGESPLSGRLAAALQISTGGVPVGPDLNPNGTGRTAVALRDDDVVVGVAVFGTERLALDPALPVIAALCGSNLSRAIRFDQLRKLTGVSEHTRSMQQQILDHVSHEFNTPLMILRSSADFAREASDDERELFFDMHSQALDRLEQLVRGVIEVGHSAAKGDTEQLGIEELVSSMVLPHFVDAEWPGGVPELWHRAADLWVEADPESLGLAIEHVLANARIHATPSGARVAVAIYGARSDAPDRGLDEALTALSAGEESLPPEPEVADSVILEVIDTGPGIPAAELGTIFEPFTQASNSPIRGVSGAGMGLATATRQVEAVGGVLEVESSLGSGSLFRFRLPAH
jgi:signal transduction histidine kinase